MKKALLGIALVVVFGAVVYLVIVHDSSGREASDATSIPTASPSNSPTNSPTPSPTSSPTATPSATSTSTPTPTFTPSATATLATLVLHLTVVNPGVTLDAPSTVTPFYTATPLPTLDVPFPPSSIPLLGTGVPPVGWIRYETADPALNYVAGHWYPFRAVRASEHAYAYSSDPDARVRLNFDGAGVRVRYVAYSLFGIFEIHIDGHLAATIDSYSPRAAFLSTEIFGLTQGGHILEIINTGHRHPNSTGSMIALDDVEVYRSLPPSATPMMTATPSATVTPSPAPAKSIKLVAAPPTIKPTNTPLAPGLVTVSLIIAYDENGNKAADPAEGVRGISVRLVRVGTNEVVASGYTNSEGFIHLETLTDAQVRLVVPYFSKFWDIPVGRGAEPRFTLVIPPGNQPGLIP